MSAEEVTGQFGKLWKGEGAFTLYRHPELPEYTIIKIGPDCFLPCGLRASPAYEGFLYTPFYAQVGDMPGEEHVLVYTTLEQAMKAVDRLYHKQLYLQSLRKQGQK